MGGKWIVNLRDQKCFARATDNPLNLVQKDLQHGPRVCVSWDISRDGEISQNHATEGRLCIEFNGTNTVPSVVKCNGSQKQRWSLQTTEAPPAPRPADTTLAGAFIGFGPGLVRKTRDGTFFSGLTAEQCMQECIKRGDACAFVEFRPTGAQGTCTYVAGSANDWLPLWYDNNHGSVIYLKKGTISPGKVLLEGNKAIGTVWEGTADSAPIDPNAKDASGHTTLHRAVVGGKDQAAVKAILDEGTGADIQDTNGKTALFLAVEAGSEDMVRFLIDQGAKVDLADNSGNTPLFPAVEKNDVGLVGLLIDRGANVNATDGAGNNALAKAVVGNKDRAIVELLIDKGANPSDSVLDIAVDRRDDELIDNLIRAGLSPGPILDRAVQKLDIELSNKMLTKGAKPTETHVRHAVGKWNSELVDLLLRYDGPADAALDQAMQGDLNMVIVSAALRYGADPTPYMARAVEMGSVQLVDMFVDKGADPADGMMKAIELENKDMVLHLKGLGASITEREYIAYWVQRGKVDMVEFLLAEGADAEAGLETAIDVRQHLMIPIIYENSSVVATVEHLHRAIGGHNPAVVGAVLDQGVDANEGMQKAVEGNSGQVIKVLIERGGDPKPRELIVYAVTNDKDAAVSTLASAGARVDWTLEGGSTLLLNAAGRCSEVTSTLLFHGADHSKADASGSTALHLVAAGPMGEACRNLIDRLLDVGADVNANDHQGRTPLDVAKGGRKKRRLKKAGGK